MPEEGGAHGVRCAQSFVGQTHRGGRSLRVPRERWRSVTNTSVRLSPPATGLSPYHFGRFTN